MYTIAQGRVSRRCHNVNSGGVFRGEKICEILKSHYISLALKYCEVKDLQQTLVEQERVLKTDTKEFQKFEQVMLMIIIIIIIIIIIMMIIMMMMMIIIIIIIIIGI